jgi:hypothetical protein
LSGRYRGVIVHSVSDTKKKRSARKRVGFWKRKPEVKESRRARYRADMARCASLPLLESRVDKQADGCWVWTGLMEDSWERILPVIRQGEACMYADRAMWLAVHGKPVPRVTWLGRTCGRLDCIAPDHLFLENRLTRRARQRLNELANKSPSTYKQVMESLK